MLMIIRVRLVIADAPYHTDKTKSYLNGGSFFIHKISNHAINGKPEADVNRVKKNVGGKDNL